MARMLISVLAMLFLISSTAAFTAPQGSKISSRSFSVVASSTAGGVVVAPELKPPAAMYENASNAGGMKAAQSPFQIFILAILSGCHIAFGACLVLSVGAACPGIAKENPGLQKILMGAFGLPFGLMMTIVGGGELFTGNTALVSAALIEKKTTVKNLLKNWFVSYGGNFAGSLLMAFLVHAGGSLASSPAAVNIAIAKTSLTFTQAFVRGILCNWLVCMAVYMASGASSLPGKVTAIFFPISAFVALGLEHSVANMFLIPIGMLRGAAGITIADFLLKNLLPVTLGNIVGGVCAVTGGYAAAYGSLKERITGGGASKSLTSIRGGFSSNNSNRNNKAYTTKLFASKQMPPENPATGTSFLSEETIERAKVGNPFEKAKLEKDPTQAWSDVYEYAAAIREGTTNWEDIAKNDIDIRLKYSGLFHRRKRTPGKFMMRLRVPNGIVTSDQMRFCGESVRPYGVDDGVVDITTRANIQLRGMPLEDSGDIITGLQKLGLTSIMSGLDNVRNMVGSPIAGIDPLELFDTRDLCGKIDAYYSGNGKGNPEWCNMPRKFNIAISGSRDDFSHTHINDIGLNACPHATTGETGFNVVLGGYFSIKRAATAIPMNVWIAEKDAWNFCRSILQLFRDNGSRGDRQKARLMWLIEEWTLPVFSQRVLDQMKVNEPSLDAENTFAPVQPYAGTWEMGHRDVVGVHRQKQAGLNWVGVHVPVGRLSSDECVSLAAIADKYSAGELRFTVEQNVLFPNVADVDLDALLAEPALSAAAGSRLSVNPGNIVGGVVSCTGAQFCGLAMVETKLAIDRIVKKVATIVTCSDAVRIHMTGCPNSCGQVQVADIGLMGAPAKKLDPVSGKMKAVAGVDVYVGGTIGEHMSLSTIPAHKGIPFDEDDTIVALLADILVERHGAVRL